MNESELEMAAAYIFKSRNGKPTSLRGLAMEMSMRRKWMTYSKAVLVAEAMRDAGLLVGDEGSLEPAFAYGSVDVPSSFVPKFDDDHVSTPPSPRPKGKGTTRVLKDRDDRKGPWDDLGVQGWGIADEVIERSAAKWREDLGVGEYGALVLAGYKNGVDISDLIAVARKGDSLKGKGGD